MTPSIRYDLGIAGMLCLPFLLLAASQSHAEQQLTEHTLAAQAGAESGQATLADVQWLRGFWRGTGLGAEATESWSPSEAGTMTGTFRLIKNGELVFSEFFLLVEVDGSLELRLKHFDKDLKGWEPQDQHEKFRLIKVEDRTAYFHGLTYQLDENDRLHAWVAMKRKDGTFREGAFEFQRVRIE